MNKTKLLALINVIGLTCTLSVITGCSHGQNQPKVKADGSYIVVVEGYDWGPAVSKAVLTMDEMVISADPADYQVMVMRSTDLIDIPAEESSGERTVTKAFVSDASGNPLDKGRHITLELAVGPDLVLASPFKYVLSNNGGSNYWIDYHLIITNKALGSVWDSEIDRIMPLIDRFDISGKFLYHDSLTMSYAFYEPETGNDKSPLIIWLHGGGEGGYDPTIPLIANRAANYASDEIQNIFGGAYVLVPQCPGAWMHNAMGVSTHGKENNVYNEGLMALIEEFVSSNPGIDSERIYIGGCSNGGYMSLKLIMLYPDYFAAGFISALAYQSQYITDEQIQTIKDVPIWFVHSKDDQTTLADITVIPLYERLIAASAGDVHFSFYDHVVDISGRYGGENHHYDGHWSWIYSHANQCTTDYDGAPVTLNGRPVTIMEWMAAMSNGKING